MQRSRSWSDQDQQWESNPAQYYSTLDDTHPVSGLVDATPYITFTDDAFAPSEDLGLYPDVTYQNPLWDVASNVTQRNALLLTSGSPSVRASASTDSPSTSDYSYFPSRFSSPYGTPSRALPNIRVDTNTLGQGQLGPTPVLSPSYHYGQASGTPSSGPSSGKGSSIALPTPDTSPLLLDDIEFRIRRASMSSASPVSPYSVAGPVISTGPSLMDVAETEARPGDGPIIPQSKYRPHTRSDCKRYVEAIQLAEPITFYNVQTGRLGISLRDALGSRFMELDGRDQPMFEGCGPSVSIRLNWPGYMSWSRQIPTKDFRSPPLPITRSKLAKNVAKTVARFIEEVKGRPIEDSRNQRWRVGDSYIGVDDLVLIGLQHVSKGSWQAHLRLRHPRPVNF